MSDAAVQPAGYKNVIVGEKAVRSRPATALRLASLHQTYSAASDVDPYTVFNIKGNDYRLVTYVDYDRGLVVMKWFGSHAEYDKDQWK